MTTSSWNKFKSALDSAGIKKFQVDSDTDYHLFNDPDNAKIVVFDEGSETFYGIRQKIGTSSEGWGDPIVVTGVEVSDIHMIKFGATADKIAQFIEAMGLELDEEQQAAVIKINKGNYDINPITGDYVLAGFKVLSDEEIAKLTPQQKKDYEEKLKIYEERQKFTKPNQVVQITY
jgi:hypothetical protein